MVDKVLLPIDHTNDCSWKKALPANYGNGAKDHVCRAIQVILDQNNAPDISVHIEEGSVYR